MDKKKKILKIALISIAVFIGLIIVGFISIRNKSINDFKSLGMKYLAEGNYTESLRNFERLLEIDKKNKIAINLSEFSKECDKIKNLYKEENYKEVLKEIENIKTSEYYQYTEEYLSSLNENAQEKADLKDKIDSLDSEVEKYIAEKKYDDAISEINKFLKKNISEEDTNKLNKLLEKVRKEKDKDKITQDEEQKQEDDDKEEDKKDKKAKKKKEYTAKLKELNSKIDKKYKDKLNKASTVEGVTISGERYQKWDEMLNEIWGVLKETLPKSEMKSLTEEQLKWIEEKEKMEKEAYENKADRHINHLMIDLNTALGDKTKERCYELVNGHMK